MAVEYELPIQPVVTDGLHRVLPPGSLILKRRGENPVQIRYLDPVQPPYGEEPQRRVVRELARRVRESMVEELTQLRSERKSAGRE
jgi:1-acyl-sn-glycerol-3-phosphate acyltransferase